MQVIQQQSLNSGKGDADLIRQAFQRRRPWYILLKISSRYSPLPTDVNHEKWRQDMRYIDWDSKQVPAKYKATGLLTHQSASSTPQNMQSCFEIQNDSANYTVSTDLYFRRSNLG
jgi:hypothetical protein